MAQTAVEQFSSLVETANKLKDYTNVEEAIEEANSRLKGAQEELKNVRLEVARLKADADIYVRTRKQEIDEQVKKTKAEIDLTLATHRKNMTQMEENTKSVVASFDDQVTEKRAELQDLKDAHDLWMVALAKLQGAFQDAQATITKTVKDNG